MGAKSQVNGGPQWSWELQQSTGVEHTTLSKTASYTAQKGQILNLLSSNIYQRE